MKILYLFDHFPYDMNRFGIAYVTEMAKKHEVYVLASNHRFGYLRFEKEKPPIEKWENAIIIRKDPVVELRGTMLWVKDYKKIIKEINPDIIHTFEGIKISTSIMGCWAKKQGYPVVYDHENRMVGGWGKLTRWKYFLGARYFEKRIIRKADLIRAITPGAKEYLLANHDMDKRRIIPCTLGYFEEKSYPSKTLRKRFRRKRGIKKDDYVVAVSGRITRLKRIELIIKAFKKTKNKNLHLLVIGKFDEKYHRELLKKYKNVPRLKIEMNFLSLSKLNELYNGIDLMVWPHVTMSSYEALATKTPILIPYFNATFHLEGVKGVFFYGKNKKIFDRYERVINDNVRIEEMAKVMDSKPIVKKISVKQYSWKNICKEMEEDYKKLLKKCQKKN